jgi:GGDEF domain-containing protein
MILGMMPALEIAIWSAMAGVIGVLVVVAALDLAVQRSAAAARGLAFILLTGTSSVCMSGLPEALFPGLPADAMLLAKASSGPLSGALALRYLGVWTGVMHDDRLVRWTVQVGSLVFALAAALLAGLALTADLVPASDLLLAAAGVNAVSVLCAAGVAMRSASLGDALSRWMAGACACLAGMVGGLYAKALNLQGAGVGLWSLTAACTVAYFLIVISLTIQRTRMQRKLRRIARGQSADESSLDLPRGSRLVELVDDALWRSARVNRECVVVGVSVANLYELGQVAGHSIDAIILETLTARIRRVVGFRNVVGLYHPRCFILVISAMQDPRRGQLITQDLLRAARRPLVLGSGHNRHHFEPAIGISVVRVPQGRADPVQAMNLAEQLALEAGSSPEHILAGDLDPPLEPAQ